MSAHILVVDDEQAIRESLQGLFEDEGYLVSCAASGEEAIARFRKEPTDCILLDIWMPGIDGLETMARIMQIDKNVPIIIISGHATINTAVRATREGAFDFVEKPLSSERLLILLRNALEKRKLKQENADLKFNIQEQAHHQLLGQSDAIQKVRKTIEQVASTDAAVLILGELGSGKSAAALDIHLQSKRANAPFVELNTASIRKGQMHSELFGHEEGSFAGALHSQTGRFEAADEGTLFLDEISELSLSIQAKILKSIQEKQIQPLGKAEPTSIDTRIIGATSYDPDKLLNQGKLREDFLYCLNVVTLQMPPLRDRIEDLPVLIEAMTEEQSDLLGGKPIKFSTDAMQRMQAYPWAGNIRELRNYIERCHILQPDVTITPELMPPLDSFLVSTRQDTDAHNNPVFNQEFQDARGDFERSYLLHHLKEHEWDINETADAIGMDAGKLHKKIKSLELDTPEK